MAAAGTSSGTSGFSGFLEGVAARLREAGVFGPIRIDRNVLRCDALASAAPAEFRLFEDAGRVWVALVTADRWLSQSIEQDLVHTGDKIDELVEEELIDLGWDRAWGPTRVPYEHFRDEQKMYTFRSPTPARPEKPDADKIAAIALLAYERAFRVLGDMEADGDD